MTATKKAIAKAVTVVSRLQEILRDKPESKEFVLIDKEALKIIPADKYMVIKG